MKKYLTKQNITKTFQIIILTAIFSIIIICVDKYNQKQSLEQLRLKPIQSTIITQTTENSNIQ